MLDYLKDLVLEKIHFNDMLVDLNGHSHKFYYLKSGQIQYEKIIDANSDLDELKVYEIEDNRIVVDDYFGKIYLEYAMELDNNPEYSTLTTKALKKFISDDIDKYFMKNDLNLDVAKFENSNLFKFQAKLIVDLNHDTKRLTFSFSGNVVHIAQFEKNLKNSGIYLKRMARSLYFFHVVSHLAIEKMMLFFLRIATKKPYSQLHDYIPDEYAGFSHDSRKMIHFYITQVCDLVIPYLDIVDKKQVTLWWITDPIRSVK